MRDASAKLPGKQEAALVALLAHPTVRDAAKEAKIAEGTLWRYLSDPVFSVRYTEARAEVTKHLIMRLQADSTKAAKVLIDIAQDEAAPASARVTAAKAIIEGALKGAELHDLMARVEAIEASQAVKK